LQRERTASLKAGSQLPTTISQSTTIISTYHQRRYSSNSRKYSFDDSDILNIHTARDIAPHLVGTLTLSTPRKGPPRPRASTLVKREHAECLRLQRTGTAVYIYSGNFTVEERLHERHAADFRMLQLRSQLGSTCETKPAFYSWLRSSLYREPIVKQKTPSEVNMLAMQCNAIQAPVMQMRSPHEEREQEKARKRKEERGKATATATAQLNQDHSCPSS
jgi:hypothetical protein